MSRAALIVLGYGQFDSLTRHCLDSILPAAVSLGVPVLAVDNGSPDDSASQLQAYAVKHPALQVLLTGENLGFAGGMNHGIAATDADWVVLVNSDTRFAPGALARLIDAFDRAAPQVGIIGPLTNAAGNGQYLALEGDTPDAIISSAGRLLADDTGVLIPCYRADFFCVGVRRALWATLGGLDTVFGKGYYEDFDFSMRAMGLGFISVICEDAFVYHAGSSSFKRSPGQKQLIRRNKDIFLSRHPDARMPHRRDDNLAVLAEYARFRRTGAWNDALESRQVLRVGMLFSDLPRNPVKRWLWCRKVKKSGFSPS
jgi:GT2 family glycosyltransferase